jgi:DNA end-binding protein Ku
MAPRALASTTLFIARAAIPVRVYSATKDPPSISFNFLHPACGSKVKQQYVCPTDNALPDREDLVKGYEVSKDRYVVFTTAELEALEETPEPGIHVEEFLELARIDPIYFSKAFRLGPDKGYERPYRLLFEVMTRMGKVALARHAQRGKQRLVVVRPGQLETGVIILQQLLHAEEVREIEEGIVPSDPPPTHKVELRLLSELVGKMSVDAFHPENYPDAEYARMLEKITAKIEGKEVTAPIEVEGRKQYVELADALTASLEERARPKRAAR